MIRHTNWCLFVFVIFQICGCSKSPYIWVETLSSSENKTAPYRIRAGDQIEVAVWNQTQISGTFLVRQDGFITVPLVGDLAVAGLTLDAAADAIKARLEGDIVQDASVVVIARETAPQYVSVMGEVRAPGQFVLKPGDTIIDILASAGGLTEFADKSSIYLIRGTDPILRVRFDYERLTSRKTGGIKFKIQPGDTVIVE